jgi:hypothetical protein
MPTIHTAIYSVFSTALVVAGLLGATVDAGAAAPAHGRVWELVTPPDPNGSPVGGVYGIAPTGDRLAYYTIGPPPGSQAGSLVTPSFARRTPLGWDSVPMALPYTNAQLNFSPQVAVAANEDMSSWIWRSTLALTPDGPVFPSTGLYSSGIGGSPTLLADAGSTSFEYVGASADLRHLVFQTGAKLLAEDVRTSGVQAYEITDAGLRLVGVDSGGAPLSACGAIVGSNSYPPNPISRDGRRVFVTSPDADCGTSRRKVYVREDGTTTEISASRCTRPSPPCNAAADVRFMGATPSGSTAFIATSQQLTDDDVDSGQDLYRYDVAAGTLTRVSVGPPAVAAAVTTTAAYPSDDGSRVYFVATGALIPGKGAAGSPNVYVSDDQGLRFVATINSADSWQVAASFFFGREDVQLTPDGRRLVFMSTSKLTADDTDSSKDVYLYDANDDTLSRASGIGANGNGAFNADITQSSPSIQMISGYPLRSISDDGRHLFLWTNEPLTPDDVNTTSDVYEWADGDVALITSGATSGSVNYRTASADGSSVFFTTDESLTPADDDLGDPDLYVAREGGGFPAQEEPPPAACAGGECAPSPAVRLNRTIPFSVGFLDAAASAPTRFGALPVSAAARRRMAASGWLRLRVRAAKPGRIVARALARVGRRTRVVASGDVSAARGGVVTLRLRLSALARRRLGHGHALLVRVALRRSRPNRASAVLLRLEPPR